MEIKQVREYRFLPLLYYIMLRVVLTDSLIVFQQATWDMEVRVIPRRSSVSMDITAGSWAGTRHIPWQ
jgi:hypothetical protein